jgi:uncharacterized protein
MTGAENLLASRLIELRELCTRLRVRKLEIFGSATSDRFDPQTSDLDFLYEFNDLDAPDIADRFFALWEGLEQLFGRRVDLVSSTCIRNPYFLRKVNTQRRVLYAA